MAVMFFNGRPNPTDQPIEIGQLDTTVYEEVQHVAQINHLRHSRFIALREDKKAKDVGRDR